MREASGVAERASLHRLKRKAALRAERARTTRKRPLVNGGRLIRAGIVVWSLVSWMGRLLPNSDGS